MVLTSSRIRIPPIITSVQAGFVADNPASILDIKTAETLVALFGTSASRLASFST